MYTLTIRDETYAALRSAVLSAAPLEGAAYLLCGESRTGDEHRLIVRDVIPVRDEHYLLREPARLSIASGSYVSAAKRARSMRASVLFVHSHPGGPDEHSRQDDREEPGLMEFLSSRVQDRVHGSAVVGVRDTAFSARVHVGGRWVPIERVRIIGSRFRFLQPVGAAADPVPEFFDRQVRAFGPELQRLLRQLHVGVVGAGGTGSAVAEQLARLGVGELSLFDHDTLTATNVTRVYGSRVVDQHRLKVEMLAAHLDGIGLGTRVRAIPRSILEEDVAKQLRDCDVVFGCTDKESPRGILNQVALDYLIPVFDTGVAIDAPDHVIQSIVGRVTILTPGQACLFCRRRITAEAIRDESLPAEERLRLEQEGYAPTLAEPDPAVITFTTAVAARAVTEFLNRLTGAISGSCHSEFLVLFHAEKVIRTQTVAPEDCACGLRERWGQGDRRTFLGLMWMPPTPRRSARP